MIESDNSYQKLRQRCLGESSREFKARGKSVARCERCQLASFACLCPWRATLNSRCEFVVLMHRNEVFKPTNSGRLVVDLLPHNTHVYLWSRTQPEASLLQLLADPQRECFIVFPVDLPSEEPGIGYSKRKVVGEVGPSVKTPTFVLLDGTWKQSGRMFHLSRWLEDLPCLSLPENILRGYAVRKSHQAHYLSTLEAAGLCLQAAGETIQSDVFFDYFSLFNLHYLATRGCYTPEQGDVHKRLAAVNSVQL